VVAYDPFVAPGRFGELGVDRAGTPEDVYAVADFVTFHLPLTDETRGSVDAAAFARMRDGVRVVNAARGDLIDEPALIDALKSGKVAGAAIDVFATEPYSGPLLELDSVVVTPHLAASTTEAQDRAGVVVAEQVADALEGRMVANAVNIPAISPEEADALAPFVPLAAQLARLAFELAGEPGRIELTYHGGLAERDTRLLTVSALNGAFQGRVDRQVNWVNAPLVAAELGVEVSEERRRTSHDFTNLIGVTVADATVEGTTIGTDGRRWLVTALGFGIDLELSALMVFFVYDDVPGVIGRVGTLFGGAGVNIANMAVSRTRQGGKALMALSIDSPAPQELQDRLQAEGFDDARFIQLGE